MSKRKSFKSTGAEAVSKFFSEETINKAEDQIKHDTLITQLTPDVQITHSTPNEEVKHEIYESNSNSEVNDKVLNSSTHDTHSTHNTQMSNQNQEKKKRVQAKPRINMSFDENLLEYMHIMARLDGVSVTKYVNNLILNDMNNRAGDYENAEKLFNNNK